VLQYPVTADPPVLRRRPTSIPLPAGRALACSSITEASIPAAAPTFGQPPTSIYALRPALPSHGKVHACANCGGAALGDGGRRRTTRWNGGGGCSSLGGPALPLLSYGAAAARCRGEEEGHGVARWRLTVGEEDHEAARRHGGSAAARWQRDAAAKVWRRRSRGGG